MAKRDRMMKALFAEHFPSIASDDIELLIEVFSEATEEAGNSSLDSQVLANCLLELCLEGSPEDPDAAAADLVDELNHKFSIDVEVPNMALEFRDGDGVWAVLAEDGDYHEATVISTTIADGNCDAVDESEPSITVRFADFGIERTLGASQVVLMASDSDDGDDDELWQSGACEMCRRDCTKLTIHHMIPRSEHARFLKKGYTVAELKGPKNFAMICRPCHNTVHRVASNKVLADTMYTIDLINAHPAVQKWVAFASTKTIHKLSGKCR